MKRVWLIIATLALLPPSLAVGRTISVMPGSGTLQAAIDVASPNDTLHLINGTYAGAIVINKPLKILTDRPKFLQGARIDAQCGAAVAVTIAADHVRMDRVLVWGGTLSDIDVQGRSHVTLTRLAPAPTCAGVQHAINAVDVAQLVVKDVEFDTFDLDANFTPSQCSPPALHSRDYDDAALYLGGTAAGARNRISRNFFCSVQTGIVVEHALASAAGPPSLTLQNNIVNESIRGIALRNADGVAIRGNRVSDTSFAAVVGIDIDANSDNNVLSQNTISGYPDDVRDLGASNCWRSNHFTTGTVPSTGCP